MLELATKLTKLMDEGSEELRQELRSFEK